MTAPPTPLLSPDALVAAPPPGLVLDTNAVLALWMFRDPALRGLRDWIEAANCRLFSREDALEELRRVLAYRQFAQGEAAQASLLAAYCARVTLATETRDVTDAMARPLPRCSDADDQKFLEIAWASQAKHLLTRDKALLRLRRHVAIRPYFAVETPERFQQTVTAAAGA